MALNAALTPVIGFWAQPHTLPLHGLRMLLGFKLSFKITASAQLIHHVILCNFLSI